MPALTDHCTEQLARASAEGRVRRLRAVERQEGAYLWREGRKLLNFAGNDYLGLSQDARVIAAAVQGAALGAGAGSSRLISGECAGYAPLEQALAAYHGQAAALVFSSGYAANLGTIAALAGEGDLILADKLVHACMIDGARLSGATLKRFAHNDIAHAEALLHQHRALHRHCFLLTEAIFSMDGDAAPLMEMQALAERHAAWFVVDAAHALAPLAVQPDVLIGTLSKSLGAVGGFVAAPRAVIDWLISSARPLLFSTALPPSVLASAYAALRVAEAEPQRARDVHARAQRLAEKLALPAPAAAILPVPVGENTRAMRWSEALEVQGFAVPAIRPPTVPPGTARLRVSMNARHTEAEVDALAEAMRALRGAA